MVHTNKIKLSMLGLALAAACPSGAQTKIGGAASAGDASAVLELQSSSQGLLLPRLTTAQRNGISSPATGLAIYNTDDNCIQVYKGAANGGWYSFCNSGGGDLAFTDCNTPVITGAIDAQVPTTATIQLNYTNGTGQLHGFFVSSTVNGITLTAPGGSITPLTAPGGTITLTASGTPTSAGNISIPIILAGASCSIPVTVDAFQGNVPVACGTAPGCTGGVSPASAVAGDKICWGGFEYRAVSIGGKLWFDRNLGAQRVATSATDVQAYGDNYQWGRRGDGHQCTIFSNGGSSNGGTNGSSPTANTRASTATPGNQFFIVTSLPYNWISPENTTLWDNSATGGTNNPCPPGWCVPTASEQNTALSGSGNSMSTALKFPLAGYRQYSDGTMGSQGAQTHVWASAPHAGTQQTYDVYWPNASSGPVFSGWFDRAFGFSVRCVKH